PAGRAPRSPRANHCPLPTERGLRPGDRASLPEPDAAQRTPGGVALQRRDLGAAPAGAAPLCGSALTQGAARQGAPAAQPSAGGPLRLLLGPAAPLGLPPRRPPAPGSR